MTKRKASALRNIYANGPAGDFVEFGCKDGELTRRMIGHVDRGQIIVFDTFTGHIGTGPEDGKSVKVAPGHWAAEEGSREQLEKDLKGIGHVVVGDVRETAAAWFAEHDAPVALVLLDLDLYAPTKAALEAVFPHVVSGGSIVADEYRLTDVYPGEQIACNEVLAKHTWLPSYRRANRHVVK